MFDSGVLGLPRLEIAIALARMDSAAQYFQFGSLTLKLKPI